MKIGIITWLESAEFEDVVLQALLTEGISSVELEFRALSIDSLVEFLANKPDTDSRFILIHDVDEISSALERELRRFPGAIRMAIEPVIGDVTVEIERIVNRALREFETIPAPRKSVQQIGRAHV